MSDEDSEKLKPKKLSEIVADKAGLISTQHTIEEAGVKMRELDATSLPVTEERKLVGTVTGSHPDLHVAGRGHDPKSVLVGEGMSREVFFCYEDEDAGKAAAIMAENNLRYLPVVDREMKIIGMITQEDAGIQKLKDDE